MSPTSRISPAPSHLQKRSTASAATAANPGSLSGHQSPGALEERHFLQSELGRRWKISPRTLERWRTKRKGPRYLRLGGRIVYRLEDIEAYERNSLRLTEGDLE